MARPVAEINNQILDFLVPNMATVGIIIDTTQWSKRNILRCICYVMALAINYFEQLQDVFMQNVETTVANAPGASRLYLQSKMFQFQYSVSNPQVLQLIGVAPQYVPVEPSLQIITACSVRTAVTNYVQIKVAKGNPFTALSSLELAAAQSYINELGAAGITYIVSSANADQLFINAIVYYKGQYASVIQATVIQAINSFLQQISVDNFDGYIKMSDIENTIRNVTGVNDVLLSNVRARADGVPFASGTDLVLGQQVISRLWNTSAGYIVSETTTGKTLADSLQFIAE